MTARADLVNLSLASHEDEDIPGGWLFLMDLDGRVNGSRCKVRIMVVLGVYNFHVMHSSAHTQDWTLSKIGRKFLAIQRCRSDDDLQGFLPATTACYSDMLCPLHATADKEENNFWCGS